MTGKHYSRFHSLLQKITSTRAGSWFLARAAHPVDKVFLKMSSGRVALSTLLTGLPVVVLTSTGARSGLRRTLPVAFIRDPATPRQFAVIASNFGRHHHPAWYFNLKANPRATCSIDGQVKTYLAREVDGEEYTRFWRYATETYLGFPLYQQRAGKRHIPIMVLSPEHGS